MTIDTPTRADRKQQTRTLLINTALDLMAERGIAATRTIDVAERAGVAHGTVFVHFPTRYDLVTAVVAEHSDQIAGRLHELAGGLASTNSTTRSRFGPRVTELNVVICVSHKQNPS